MLQQMKKFKKFLDKKKKMSSVSEEERFMYEVRTLHADLITIIAYLHVCAMPHVYFDTAVHAICNISSTIGKSITKIYDRGVIFTKVQSAEVNMLAEVGYI